MSLNGGPEVRTMDRKLCPIMQKACVGSECALWMRYDRADGVAFEACTFVLSTILHRESIVEQIHTQASADKIATVTFEGFAGLMRGMANYERRSLSE